jgi:hypothetical protein
MAWVKHHDQSLIVSNAKFDGTAPRPDHGDGMPTDWKTEIQNHSRLSLIAGTTSRGRRTWRKALAKGVERAGRYLGRKDPKTLLALAAAVTGVVTLFKATQTQATPYYWDTNGNATGFGNASGTWGSSAYWSTSSAGTTTPSNVNTTTSDAVNFGTSSTGLGGGTINVTGSQDAVSITIGSANSGAITLWRRRHHH